jgi:divalent metal cation (Fe/Co/Zn/Cd) transporter
MDGLDPGDLNAAENAATAVPGVRSAAANSRWMGRTLLLETEGRLDGSVPLAQADQISRQVEAAIARAVPTAGRVHYDTRPEAKATVCTMATSGHQKLVLSADK